MTTATRTTTSISASETPPATAVARPAQNMLTGVQIGIRAVFPTGPHGDLSSDHARELDVILAAAGRRSLDFDSDGSRPKLHVTAWLTHPRSPGPVALNTTSHS